MKRLVIIIGIILMFSNVQCAFATNWQIVSYSLDKNANELNDMMCYHIDKDTIKHSKVSGVKYLTVWVKTTNINGKDFRGATDIIFLFKFREGKNSLEYTISRIIYYKNNEIIEDSTPYVDFQTIPPGSNVELIYKAAKKTFIFW